MGHSLVGGRERSAADLLAKAAGNVQRRLEGRLEGRRQELDGEFRPGDGSCYRHRSYWGNCGRWPCGPGRPAEAVTLDMISAHRSRRTPHAFRRALGPLQATGFL